MFFALKGVPYAFFRERFLRLPLPKRMQIPTVAIINGEPRELLRLEGPTEPRKKGVIQMTQYVPLERHPLAPAIARTTAPETPRPTVETTFRFRKSSVSPRRRSSLPPSLLSLSPPYMVDRVPRGEKQPTPRGGGVGCLGPRAHVSAVICHLFFGEGFIGCGSVGDLADVAGFYWDVGCGKWGTLRNDMVLEELRITWESRGDVQTSKSHTSLF